VEAESVCLWLLSSVATEDQESVCIEGLVEKEECLQEAQCHDALEKICALQQAKSHLITFKWWNISGQRKNTQAQSSLEALDNKIDLNTQHYKDAHNALYALCGPGDWMKTLRTLKSSDLVPPVTFDIDNTANCIGSDGHAQSAKQMKDMVKHLREGYQQVSWIWSMDGVLGDGKDSKLNDGEFLMNQLVCL
ncbi:hypothetical protein BDN71DRAFT_1404229, partial [Pleurotus eryngii]